MRAVRAVGRHDDVVVPLRPVQQAPVPPVSVVAAGQRVQRAGHAAGRPGRRPGRAAGRRRVDGAQDRVQVPLLPPAVHGAGRATVQVVPAPLRHRLARLRAPGVPRLPAQPAHGPVRPLVAAGPAHPPQHPTAPAAQEAARAAAHTALHQPPAATTTGRAARTTVDKGHCFFLFIFLIKEPKRKNGADSGVCRDQRQRLCQPDARRPAPRAQHARLFHADRAAAGGRSFPEAALEDGVAAAPADGAHVDAAARQRLQTRRARAGRRRHGQEPHAHLVRARAAAGVIKGDNADQDAGIKLVLKAIEAPLREIVANAGGEASVVINAVVGGSGNYGFNAANDTYGDMIEMGILDPAKVTRSALQNAASVAGLILTTDALVAELPEDKPAAGGMGGHDMGGMGGMGGMM